MTTHQEAHPPAESLTMAELEETIGQLRRPLMKALKTEATKLGNVDDQESLTRLLDGDESEFELSEYWGYDTRPDAPDNLRILVKRYEQHQGVYVERLAQRELRQNERRKMKQNWLLVAAGLLAAMFISVWVPMSGNRFSRDLRKRRLLKLPFVPSFSKLTGDSLTSLSNRLAPPPERFFQLTHSFDALIKRPYSSPFAPQITIWKRVDAQGNTQSLQLTGQTNQRITVALQRMALKAIATHPQTDALLLAGVIRLNKEAARQALPSVTAWHAKTGMFRSVQVPSNIAQNAQKAIQHALAKRQPGAFDKFFATNQEHLIIQPITHKGKTVSLRISWQDLPQKAFAKLHKGYLTALLQAARAPKAKLSPTTKQTIAKLSVSALWDAILRNQAPPLAPLRSTYKQWSHNHRQAIWLALYQALLKQALPLHLLRNHRVIFQTSSTDTHVTFLPHWVLDAKRESLSFRKHVPHWKQAIRDVPAPQAQTAAHRGYLAKYFPKMYNIKGIRSLLTDGILYPTFERYWRVNVPVHPQFSIKHGKRWLLGQQHKVYNQIQRELGTLVAYQRIARYLREENLPKIGFILAWLRQAPLQTLKAQQMLASVRSALGPATFHTPVRSASLRSRIATQLEQAAHGLQKQVEARFAFLKTSPFAAPPLRLLHARLDVEQARYKQALSRLLTTTSMLAFYHPLLQFKASPHNHKGKLTKWQASLDTTAPTKKGAAPTPILLIKAASTNKPMQLILTLKGPDKQDLTELMTQLNKLTTPPNTPDSSTLADQLLVLTLPIRQELKHVFSLLRQPTIQQRLRLELALGCHPPESVRIPASHLCRWSTFKPPVLVQFGSPFTIEGKTGRKPAKRIPISKAPLHQAPRLAPPTPREDRKRKALIQIP